MELLEKILDDRNLYNAYKQVYKNKGASGIDGVTVEELGVYLFQHKEEITPKLLELLEYTKNNLEKIYYEEDEFLAIFMLYFYLQNLKNKKLFLI